MASDPRVQVTLRRLVTSTMTPGEAIVQAADELERALENELGDDPAVLPRVWAKAAADWLRAYAVDVDVEDVRQRAERALCSRWPSPLARREDDL